MSSVTEEAERDHVDRFLETVAEELPPIDLAVEAMVDRINGLARRVRRMMEDTLAGFGLGYGDWEVLTALRWAGPPYRRSPGKLAERAELSTGAMTSRLDRLEQAGLVRRLPDPSDRRALEVELTDEGLRVWESSVGVQAEKEALIASALDEGEKEQLNALLRRLMLTFERQETKKKSVPAGG
jgi:DNA-binding MarR family transcriptional regulator